MSDATAPVSGEGAMSGGRRHGATVKTLKRVLKKAGLKTTGKKAALTRRAKKARLMRGGVAKPVEEVAKVGGATLSPQPLDGGRRRRGSKKFLGVF